MYEVTRQRRRTGARVLGAFLGLLFFSLIAGVVFLSLRPDPVMPPPPKAPPAQHLALADRPARAFNPADIPSWLFVHVGGIAALQVLAVLAAAIRAGRPGIQRADARIIQFLVEIPMYLGLFGTLVGVCLTQFMEGSLVAPLAYLTTMSGIVLHVIGKLFVLLPLPDTGFSEME